MTTLKARDVLAGAVAVVSADASPSSVAKPDDGRLATYLVYSRVPPGSKGRKPGNRVTRKSRESTFLGVVSGVSPESGTPFRELIAPDAPGPVDADTPVREVYERLVSGNALALPVTSGDGVVLGAVTRDSIIDACLGTVADSVPRVAGDNMDGTCPAVVEALRDIVLLVDGNGRVVFANAACCAVLGKSGDKVPGEPLSSLLPAENLNSLSDAIKRAFSAPFHATLEQRLGTEETGYWVSWDCTALRGRAGEITGILCVGRDIGESRSDEESIRRSWEELQRLQAQSQAILRGTPHGLCMVSGDWSIRYANTAFRRILDPHDRNPDRVFGLAFESLFPSAVAFHDYRQQAMNVIRAGGEDSRELQLRRADGAEFWCDLTFVQIDPAEPGAGYVATVRDITDAKAAELELRHQRDFTSAIFDTTSALVIVLDREGGIVRFNKACEDASGYSFGEVSGRCFLDFLILPEERDRVGEAFRSIVKSGSWEGENYWVARDGTRRLIHWSGTRTDELLENFGYVVGVGIDITERRQTEAELRSTDAKLRCLIEQSLVGAFIVQGGRLVYANPRLAEILGYTEDELYAMPSLFPLIHEEDRAYTAEEMRKRFEGEVRASHYRFRAMRKDGETIVVAVHGSRADINGVPSSVGVFVDVTDQVQAEEELRKLSVAVEQSPGMVIITDNAGRVEYVNPCFTTITGWEPREVIGEKPPILTSGLNSPEVCRELWDTILSGNVWHGELCNKKKTGQLYWVDATISPIRDRNGNATHFLWGKVDITERKRTGLRREVLSRLNLSLANARSAERVARIVRETTGSVWEWDVFSFDVCLPGSLDLTTLVLVDTVDGEKREFPRFTDHVSSDRRIREFWRGGGPILCHGAEEIGNGFPQCGNSSRVSESMIHVPIITGGGVVGVVSIQSYTAGIYGEEDRDFLAEIATVAGPVLERCRAEDELRKLSLAVEQGPVMAMITDTKGKIEYVNPRFTEVSGWGFKEIVGENPRFLKSGEMPDDVYRNLWETISLGKVWRGELCNRAKSGALYWESASISPIRDAEGTITHYLGVMLDITEFKKAERRRDLGARLGYRLAGSHTIEQVANVVRETTEELWQWDSFALDVCSRGSLEMMTLVCVDTVDGVKREYEAVEHGLAQERRTSGFWKGEATLLNREQPDVGPKFVSFGESSRRSASLIHAPLLAGGEVVGVLTIQSYSPFMFDEGDRDLLAEIANLASPALERCRAEADNLRLAETIRQANDVVLIMGTDWRIKYVNPAFETSTGYTLAESLNRLPRELLDGGDHGDEFYREIEQLLESGRAWSGHLVSRHKDGSRIDEEATVSPIRDSSGRIINYIGVKRDVSREMLLQEELRQAQKMEAIGLLAGGVAHDFNNLLQIILGNSHLMQQQLQPGSAMASELDSVLRAAKRGASLTRQLLAFSRKQLLEPRVVNPNSAVANIESLIRRLIGEDVELHLVLDPRAGCILVDPGQLDSVLMNLSINARDAMQEGGVLTIRTANVDVSSGDAEKSPGMKPGNFVRITVTDTGCGMDEQTRQRVFEPFFTTKKSGEGTGLGLSMVYGIVKQSNGYVYVESRPGAGASFHVYLSRVSSPLVAEDRSGEEPAGEPGWETILVVEDDVDVRKLMCGFLRANGYTVLEARNGFDGLRAAEHHNGPIHLLLTDIVMPRMGGAELARQFRAIHPDTRVLYVSGYTDNAMVRQALADSGGAFVQKPVSPDVLSDKVRETLDS